ncbi:MAG: DUF2378 family protein [Myxococcales bacterium]|nr:DUF2378 family protein [Myxococcales bacterium]
MPLAPGEEVPVENWVVFAPGAEGLKAVLGKDLSPELAEKLKALGLDFSKPLQVAYPASQFEAWVALAASTLFPHEDPGQAQRLLGQRFFDGWRGTLTGAAASAFLRVIGPRRALARVGRAFRNGNNFTVTSTTFESESIALVEFLQTQDLPDFVRGVLEAGLVLMHVTGEVDIVSRGGRQFVLRVTWSPGN